jgi:hypothetical protein
VITAEGLRSINGGEDEAVTLIGDAGAALGSKGVGILDGDGAFGDEGVLTVVDQVGEGVGEAAVEAVGHAAVQGDGCAVIGDGSAAIELVDSAELGDGAGERVDAGYRVPSGEYRDRNLTVGGRTGAKPFNRREREERPQRAPRESL